ncbi:helix-turn-helix domain-containing protein [Paenibacillus sp. 19GGS1-52]|uniref:helix-turn-helix domain-containing protein n=1 Tax=Paenibacillus sp. 19GGS1-52 TaxID=2758563 RepID=UPI001EFB46DF|nr:helix-turn-helix domain-containing protein [Paenibacillus sp. 19GGS1-52]
MNLKQFAEGRGVSINTVRRWVRIGMPRIKITSQGKVLIDVGKAEKWLLQYKREHSTDCLSLEQAAQMAQVHRWTIRYWLKQEAFREAVVISGKTSYKISKQELEKWLDKQTMERTEGDD